MPENMPVLVQKFGGTSLATNDRIRNAAELVISAKQDGHRPVVAASAMGSTTDDLLKLAYDLTGGPGERDLDLLLSTGEVVSSALLSILLNSMGAPAAAVTGPAAGIVTDGRHGKARIKSIDPTYLRGLLNAGVIPVVAGFQGGLRIWRRNHARTGASDTTAVALAVALGADHCEINTDVDGIFSTDPRIEPEARKLDRVSYEEILEMASLGAKVMHPRSIEVAQRHKIRIVVRSSFNRNQGTEILSRSEIDIETGDRVRAVVHNANVARITVQGVPDTPGLAKAIFQPLADSAVNVDIIRANLAQGGNTDISFSVERTDLEEALRLVSSVAKDVDAGDVTWSSDLGTVSIVGLGMQSAPGVAAQMFGALASADINITSITTSEIRITCLIDENRLEDAVQVLHESFGLGNP